MPLPEILQAVLFSSWCREDPLGYKAARTLFSVGNTVLKHLHEVGVKVRTSNSVFAHILTKDRLRTMYLSKDQTMKQIADRLGCSIATVHRLLTIHGLRRPEQVRRKGKRRKRTLPATRRDSVLA